jgi:hypothetical protein
MNSDKIFDRVADAAEVSRDQLPAARAWFKLGLAASNGELNQKARLLVKQDEKLARITAAQLSQGELNFLVKGLARLVTQLHEDRAMLKIAETVYYHLSDKDRPEETAEAFQMLNLSKQRLTENKAARVKLAKIIRKLKLQR